MSAALAVLNGGVLTTVQDAGRPHARQYGVPTGGAMDRFALHAANRVLQNSPEAAVLEITAGGATVEVVQPTVLAVTGADLGASINDLPLALWTAVVARRGDRIAFATRQREWGARAYLAIAGGIDVLLLLGSRSTLLSSGFGGLEGRNLCAGDMLASGMSSVDVTRIAGRPWPAEQRPAYSAEPTLRFIPGPHSECFAKDALELLAGASFQIGQHANRMGYRLEGAKLPHVRPCSIPSLGVIPGVIQVPPDGAPILLMAEAQTTGGYPIIGTVIAADMPLAAQLLPGDQMRFIHVSHQEAVAARREYTGWCNAVLSSDAAVIQVAWAGALD